MVLDLQYRISKNGTFGWYWEIFTPDNEVVGRGISDTQADAARDVAKEMLLHSRATPRLNW